MLKRVLEPEVMETIEDARDYDAMDHSAVNRAFVADFLRHWTGDGTVLDVGTGTAQIPIELCRQHPNVEVVAIDASPAMIEWATRNIARAGLAKRITLQLVDAKKLSNATFAAVMSNSIVHHIPEPRGVLSEMARVGRSIFVRDLLRPESDAEVNRLVGLYAGDCNDHQRQLFDQSLRAALSLDEIRSLVESLGFARQTVEQTSDRHWTWAAKNPKQLIAVSS